LSKDVKRFGYHPVAPDRGYDAAVLKIHLNGKENTAEDI
jgi:hypothetical protein